MPVVMEVLCAGAFVYSHSLSPQVYARLWMLPGRKQAADEALELPGSLANLREILLNLGGTQWAPGIADLEQRASLLNLLPGQMTERHAEVARLSLLFAMLASDALNPQASVEMIEKTAGQWQT